MEPVLDRLSLGHRLEPRREVPVAERRRLVRAKADQLIAAGASELRSEDNPKYERFFVTLADPEGNEFCLV